ncbi:MAG: agmatine deiminase family protein [Muribaculaceae bacterium]|nr:agmatine deiminase family protein [Muribaculaceae bacterium]
MSFIYHLPSLAEDPGTKSVPWIAEFSLISHELRMPAEWEPQSAILMAFPHSDTDWNYMLNEVRECYLNIAKEIIKEEFLIIVAPDILDAKSFFKHIDNGKIKYYQIPTNDTWARDFGGISIVDGNKWSIIDFKFNGWGLKFASDKDNLITSRLYDKGIFRAEYKNLLSFVLEGGSIESDGKGSILTTSECLLSKNRNGAFSKSDIEEYLKFALGAKRILWLNHGFLAGDDTDSHIDTLARFIADDTIAYTKCYDVSDEHFAELNLMEEEIKNLRTANGNLYKLVALPLPDAIHDEDGNRLPATYANFLMMNNQILVPIYGQKNNDKLALDRLQEALPDYKIVGIDCNALIKQHGSLHCITMQFPREITNEL